MKGAREERHKIITEIAEIDSKMQRCLEDIEKRTSNAKVQITSTKPTEDVFGISPYVSDLAGDITRLVQLKEERNKLTKELNMCEWAISANQKREVNK